MTGGFLGREEGCLCSCDGVGRSQAVGLWGCLNH